MNINEKNIDWDKVNGLIPVVIQDSETNQVLMLGYMNEEALEQTLSTNKVTFFSRTKNRLWTKGETSGNFLNVEFLDIDCDNDAILIKVKPAGPTCHKGTISCFKNDKSSQLSILSELTSLINERHKLMPEKSYATSLFKEGKSRIAQKVGEEGVEVALACMKEDKEEIKNESADLIFHLMILLENAGLSLDDVCGVLIKRNLK